MGKPIGRFFVEVVAASVKAGASSRKLAESCVKLELDTETEVQKNKTKLVAPSPSEDGGQVWVFGETMSFGVLPYFPGELRLRLCRRKVGGYFGTTKSFAGAGIFIKNVVEFMAAQSCSVYKGFSLWTNDETPECCGVIMLKMSYQPARAAQPTHSPAKHLALTDGENAHGEPPRLGGGRGHDRVRGGSGGSREPEEGDAASPQAQAAGHGAGGGSSGEEASEGGREDGPDSAAAEMRKLRLRVAALEREVLEHRATLALPAPTPPSGGGLAAPPPAARPESPRRAAVAAAFPGGQGRPALRAPPLALMREPHAAGESDEDSPGREAPRIPPWGEGTGRGPGPPSWPGGRGPGPPGARPGTPPRARPMAPPRAQRAGVSGSSSGDSPEGPPALGPASAGRAWPPPSLPASPPQGAVGPPPTRPAFESLFGLAAAPAGGGPRVAEADSFLLRRMLPSAPLPAFPPPLRPRPPPPAAPPR